MRSFVFASVALLASAVSGHVYAQSVPDMLGPGQVIRGSGPNDIGGTNYVVQNADGTHMVIKTGPRGGIRSVVHHDGALMDPAHGFTYALGNGPLIYRRYDPNLHQVNAVSPGAMNRDFTPRYQESEPDKVLGGGNSGNHGGGDR